MPKAVASSRMRWDRLFPAVGRKDLAVAYALQPGEAGLGGQDDGSSHYGPRQRTAPHLIDAGHQLRTLGPEVLLKQKGGRNPPCVAPLGHILARRRTIDKDYGHR